VKLIQLLALHTDLWRDNVWIDDSTPVECARSRPTATRSNVAGWARYCASHSRFFWGLRLHLVCTPAGLPITWALADPKIDERQVLMAMCDHDPTLLATRPGLTIIADKGWHRRGQETATGEGGGSAGRGVDDGGATPVSGGVHPAGGEGDDRPAPSWRRTLRWPTAKRGRSPRAGAPPESSTSPAAGGARPWPPTGPERRRGGSGRTV